MLMRAAVAGAALLVVAGGCAQTRDAGSPPTAAAGVALDGYPITRLPQGVARVGDDSFYTARVTAEGLINDGPGPAPGDPSASVTMRRYERADGAAFFVTVLRPVTGDAATIGAHLLTGATYGATPVATFDTPVGTAQMLTDSRAVVATPDHVVITVEGNGEAGAPEIRDLAQSNGG